MPSAANQQERAAGLIWNPVNSTSFLPPLCSFPAVFSDAGSAPVLLSCQRPCSEHVVGLVHRDNRQKLNQNASGWRFSLRTLHKKNKVASISLHTLSSLWCLPSGWFILLYVLFPTCCYRQVLKRTQMWMRKPVGVTHPRLKMLQDRFYKTLESYHDSKALLVDLLWEKLAIVWACFRPLCLWCLKACIASHYRMSLLCGLATHCMNFCGECKQTIVLSFTQRSLFSTPRPAIVLCAHVGKFALQHVVFVFTLCWEFFASQHAAKANKRKRGSGLHA